MMGTIYCLTIKEMLRKKFMLLVLLLGVVFLAIYGLGLYFVGRDMQRHASPFYPIVAAQLMSMAIYLGGFLSALLVVFSVAGSVAGEIENGILHSIVPKPVRRVEIIGGKFAGIATVGVLFNVFLLSAVLGISFLISRQPIFNPLSAVGYYCLQPMVLLAVTMYLSILLPPMASGVTGFMLFMIGAIGGIIEQFGAFFNNRSLVNTGIITSLFIPTDPLYRLIYAGVVPKTGGILAKAGPFGAASMPSLWMVVYAAVYILCFFCLSIRAFSRKDL